MVHRSNSASTAAITLSRSGKYRLCKQRRRVSFQTRSDRIQLRAVGRQIVQNKVFGVLFSPLLVQPGMMISRVVSDDNHSAPGSDAGAAKAFHKRKEGHAVKFVNFPAELESPVSQPHCAEVSHTPRRRSMHQNRTFFLRR